MQIKIEIGRDGHSKVHETLFQPPYEFPRRARIIPLIDQAS